MRALLQIGLFIGAVGAVIVPVSMSYGQIDNTDNPFTNQADAGAVDKIAVPGAVDGTNTKDAFVNVVKGAVNWILGILALIALVISLYGGFLMVTAAGEEDKYKKGFTILKQAAFGLALIGVARFILSLVFWLINLTTSQAWSSAGTDS